MAANFIVFLLEWTIGPQIAYHDPAGDAIVMFRNTGLASFPKTGPGWLRVLSDGRVGRRPYR
jgi:hypothetical protein